MSSSPTRTWGKLIMPVRSRQLGAPDGILRQVDLVVLDPARVEQLLGTEAERAGVGGVDGDCGHYFTKYSEGLLGGSLKTEAVVLRSHALRRGRPDPASLYPDPGPDIGDRQGRAQDAQPLRRPAGAVLPAAAGAARGALGPADGHQRRDRRELFAAARRWPDARCSGRAPATRSTGCSARPSRSEPVFHLLCNELALLEGDAAHAGHANQLAFRLKLLVAAGFAPQLSACAACGERDHLVGFSGAAGGVVCAACEGGGVRAGGRGARLPDRRARAAAGRRAAGQSAGAAPGRARDRRDGRAPRPRPFARGVARIGCAPWAPPSGCMSSPRARARCATCWAARGPTSRR